MKNTLLSLTIIISSLFWSTISSAQMMRTRVTLTDYQKCMEYCKTFDNSNERALCMQGCSNVGGFTSVSLKTLEQAPNLITAINSKQLKEGENEFYTDVKSGLKYEAIVSNGKLIDYRVKNKSGNIVPSRLVSVEKDRKRCFIWVNGNLVEVTCPDVVIIVHEPTTK